MNIVFAGTPEFGIPCLEAIQSSKHDLIALYTQPDRPAGRGQRLQESAVKIWGLKQHIPIYQPVNFKSPEAVAGLEALAPDLMVVIAYGLILPKHILAIPRLGCINVHASLLPFWRGAAPIQHAILEGDTQTGISIMQMDVGMDTGPVYTKETCAISPEDTGGSLHHKLSVLAPDPLLKTIAALDQGIAKANPQPESATYAPKIHKQDAEIDWQLPANVIDRKIRAYHPWPIAYFRHQDALIRIHKAHVVSYSEPINPGTVLSISTNGILIATAQDAILIQSLQYPGSRPISVADYINAQRKDIRVGTIL